MSSSTASLTASLAELASWDWCGAVICVEHCDARVRDDALGGFAPPVVKGFLSLDEEIEAVRHVLAGMCTCASSRTFKLPWGVCVRGCDWWGVRNSVCGCVLVWRRCSGQLLLFASGS